MIQKLVVSDPAVHDGELLFDGTTVPVQTLLEYRKGDVPVYEFLIDHPTVKPEDAKKAARWLTANGPESATARLQQLRQAGTPARPTGE